MKGVLVGLAVLTLWCGGASAGPVSSTATLSYTVAPGVSDYDSFVGPLGGGICLGNRRVTDPKEDGGTAWSPDGRRVAFFRATGTLTADVFVADADGSHLRNLTRGAAQYSWDPTWSPDGERILYIASNDTTEELMTVRPDGTGRTPVPGTLVDPNDQLRSPDWSPDGQWIGYSLTDGLHLIRPDGSDARFLLPDAIGFTWSADGRRIAFTRNGDLAIADADGSDVRLVTRTPNALEGGAEWSPDGTQLVYTSADNPPRGEQGPGDHIYLADGGGGHRREIYGPRGVGGWGPAWRPAAPPIRSRPCAILGTRHADRIVGTPKGDLIYAGQGNDVVHGRGGGDVIVGDVPYSAHPGKDRLFGGSGRDYIDSYDGRRDLVNGGPGKDRGIFDGHDRVRSIETRG